MTKRALRHAYLTSEAKVWLQRRGNERVILRILPVRVAEGHQCYELYTAFEEGPGHWGCVLFDKNGYWIYDGYELTVREQEHVAEFIINYIERL
jgi:hypothetical protein